MDEKTGGAPVKETDATSTAKFQSTHTSEQPGGGVQNPKTDVSGQKE